MDLLMTVLFVIGWVGLKNRLYMSVKAEGVNGEAGKAVFEDVPVGNNLMLKKEPDAFTYILKELGLY